MFACMYFVEDNSLSVVGQKSRRLQHLGQIKKRENVKMTWGKDLFLGTIVKIHGTTEAIELCQMYTKTPSEVPGELYTFNHLAKTDGKRQHRESKNIKKASNRRRTFAQRKLAKLCSLKATVKKNKMVIEKLNLSTCNLLMSDIANQFENDSSLHHNEPSSKLIHDQCAESTVRQNYPLTKSPVQQNDVCSLQVLEPIPTVVTPVGDQVPLSARACVSSARENEPPMYSPLTATWSLYTNTYRPDDNPENLFNHAAPPPAILNLFEAICQPHVKIYLQLFVDHYRNQRQNASSRQSNQKLCDSMMH